jgi:hypothetical protein
LPLFHSQVPREEEEDKKVVWERGNGRGRGGGRD